ncbi:hypothetical protein BLNAU_14863 [Blattamonas nauphoetae]|uniref:Uncharacterized protein n=1 Tax=Blattamonas nauphoetae TaxID=2049346 RepID=A0ABQ9XFQ8_9EUKA|nr:hypothetical protein BLNAU_14863 [Blattamonas nauphoetae]
MSFDEKSAVYCSLVALVKAEYPFNIALQDRAVRFLENLKPKFLYEKDLAAKLVTDLVPSSAGSPSGFVESILTLLSCPHSTVVAAALSFLYRTAQRWRKVDSFLNQERTLLTNLVETDLIPTVFATVQPHTLPIAGNEKIISRLTKIIASFAKLTLPSSPRNLRITAAIDIFNHREMIFQKVVVPSSQFVTFLISNRFILNGDLFDSFMSLLLNHIQICPFHRPTLEFVLASPIAMAFSSCLSFIENDGDLWTTLLNINSSLREWKRKSAEVAQSAKRMIQALFSEGFEDTLEQSMKRDKNGYYGGHVVKNCHFFSQLLGSNVEFTED